MLKLWLVGLCSVAVGVVGGTLVAPRLSAAPSIEARVADLQGPPTVEVPAFGASGPQKARFYDAGRPAPLVLDFHQWAGSHRGFTGTDARLDHLVMAKGWHFIRPDLVNQAENCEPATIRDAVRAAIAYAKAHAEVTDVYFVASSGGGHMALTALLAGVPATAAYVWVPVTDLDAWQKQHETDPFGADVRACAGTAEAGQRSRSPMFLPATTSLPPIHLYAGVSDGAGYFPGTPGKRHVGVVPITHSIRFYNRFAERPVTDSEILQLMELRRGPDSDSGATIGGRQIHLRRDGKISLTIFDGGHEAFAAPTVELISAAMP